MIRNILALLALLGLTVLTLPVHASDTDNPNDDDCDANPEECEEDECGEEGEDTGSLAYRLNFGHVPFEGAVDFGRLFIHVPKPGPTLFTPQALAYASPLSVRLVASKFTEANWTVELVNESAYTVAYAITSGNSEGLPVNGVYQGHGRVQLLNASRQPISVGVGNQAPTYVRRLKTDGSWLDVSVATGATVLLGAPSGRTLDVAALPEAQAVRPVFVDGVLQQVKAPQGLATLVATGEQVFEVRLYTPSQVGARDGTTGLYAFSGSPYRTVRFDNPTGNTANLNSLRITDLWGTRTKVSTFVYDEAIDQWALSQGDASLGRQQTKTSSPGPGPNDTTYTTTLKNETGQTVSTVVEVKRSLPWGMEQISRTLEPASPTLNLTTTTAYYETVGVAGYGKVFTREKPDGSWERFTYDASGRVLTKSTPWKDTALADSASGPRRITTYSYTSLMTGDTVSGVDNRPRTITESVVTTTNGSPIVTRRTYRVYQTDTTTGIYTEITEQAASATAVFGATGNLRTTRAHYTTKSTQSGYDALSAGRLYYEDRHDGTRTTYTYSQNVSGPAAYFTITEVRATAASPTGVDGLSTRTDKIHDVRGHLVETRSHIRSGGQWHLVSTEARTISGQGFHTATHRDGRQTYAATYDARLCVSRTNESGVTTTYTYDALEKIDSETRAGLPASGTYAFQPDIVTSYLRELGGLDCGCDGEVTAITSAGSLSLETVTKKDATGRRSYQKDAAGLETSYSYSEGGRQTSRINPDGGTYIDLHYRDGRHKAHTGTGAIAEHFDYGVNADGTTWTKATKVSATGDRWTKTTVNHLDQVTQVERPAHDGGVLTTTYAYNAKGQLWRTRQCHVSGATETTFIADTLTEYDAMGNATRTGLDVSGNGTLDLASADRVTDTIHTFASHESAWWRVVQTKVYPTLNSASAVQVSESRQRLSGFNSILASETVRFDVDGNITRQKQEIDFATKLLTRTTTYADSAIPAVAIARNGLLISENTRTVAAPTLHGYDALGRRISEKSPRHTQTTVTAYDSTTGQILSVTDAAGHATTYAYYPNGQIGAGKVKSITDALDNTRRTAYDLQGRVVQQWGSAEYPQAYAYTAQGELHTLTTWRDAGSANLDQATWPTPTGGDVTTWTYQASTGLLTRKQYADGKGTDYTYDQLNRLATRTWARGSSLATTYGYVPTTGELTTVDYSDSTPDVVTTYDRLGRQATITDATGTRTFAYDSSKLRLSTETLPAYFGDRVLTRAYQGTGSGQLPGRAAGFQLGTGGDPDQDYAVSYGYDNVGRFGAVTSPAGAFTYGYATDSDLLASVSSPGHDVTYGYEPNRDVRTEVRNRVTGGGTDRSRYVYAYDQVGRRSSRVQSGSAFGTECYDRFGYNDRGEVIETKRHAGTDPNDHVSDPETTALRRLYSFDHLGNRLISQEGTATARNYTSNSLNQYTQVSGFSFQPSFDADGNQTLAANGWRYQWDAENRLYRARDYDVTPANGSRQVDFVYDHQSRRIRKVVQEYNGSAWQVSDDRKFIYDGWNLIAEFRWNASSSTYDLKSAYTWGLDLSRSIQGAGGIGGLLAATMDGDSYYPAYDANGNISEYLDQNGSIAAHYEYSPFGETIKASGTMADSFTFRFSTKYEDAESGYYYYGFRYYNPSTGRWLSRDPIGERGGLGVYLFVGNSPIRAVDMLGLKDCTSVSFSVSFSIAEHSFPTPIPFIFVGVSGDGGISVDGEVCEECCGGEKVTTYSVGASVSGSATLTVTAGFNVSENYGGFSVNAWGGVQGSGGASISGGGSFSKNCDGQSSSGTGTLSGTAGLRVGASASFQVGRWSLGETGVHGGGSSTVSIPYTFSCDDSGCSAPSWGSPSADASLYVSACAFGFCFNHNF